MTVRIRPIKWLEHPLKYDYVRVRYYQSFYPRYFRKGQKVRNVDSDFWKLVGYQPIDCSDPSIYQYKLFFLKVHDRGCPLEHPNYASDKLIPDEAQLTKNLSPNG